MPVADLSFDPTRALPNSTFRDQAFFDAEQRRIWENDWVFVTNEATLAEPGDQLPVVIGDQPVLVLRSQDGDLVALSNLCAHRGTLLVDEPTTGKRIQCPYHAWTYGDDGRLLSVPFSPKGEVDKAAHCLPTYRVESWHGLVFVSLNGEVETLAERFAAVNDLLTARGIDELHHWGGHEEEVWECNWKLAALNAMESYHLFQVHPETLEPYTPTKDSYYLAGSARATATGGASKKEDDYVLVSLPPGFVGVVNSTGFVWLMTLPVTPDRCLIRTGGAFKHRPPKRDDSRLAKWFTQAASTAAAAGMPDFLPEDKAICERGQRGAVGNFTPGQLLDVERVVADFGHYLNWRLNDVEPAPVHIEPRPS